MSNRKLQAGMTLVEVLTVVVIIGLLLTLVVPSYQDSVRKARRADGQAVMLELAQWMERFYTENGRYDQDRAGDAVTDSVPVLLTTAPRDSDAVTYNIALGNLAARTFTITATPTNAQTGDKCGNLTLTEAGLKGMSVSGLTVAQCW